jgi:hypothetical protein
MQRGGGVIQGRERVEQTQNAFAFDPVADTQQRNASPSPKVAWRRADDSGHIPAGRDYSDAFWSFAAPPQVVCQRLTRHQQSVHASIREVVELGL